MSEEEKKAIEDLKKILEYWQTIVDIKDPIEREIEMSMYSEEMPSYQIKQVLNLIEKLQKENEKLSELLELTRCDLHNAWSTEKGCRKEIEKQNKIIDLLIDDLQQEGYLKFQSKDDVLSYYNKRLSLLGE